MKEFWRVILESVRIKVFLFLTFWLVWSSLVFAATPEVDSVTPAVRYQGWYGTLRIEGANFEQGITGEVSGTYIFTQSLTRESSITLEVTLLIASAEGEGYKDIWLYNPGGETLQAVNFFRVVAPAASPAFSKIHIDGSSYQHPPGASSFFAFQVEPSTEVRSDGFSISGEVTSTVTLSAVTAGLKVNISQSPAFEQVVPPADITEVNNTTLRFNTLIQTALIANQTATVVLSASDYSGVSGSETLLLGVLGEAGSSPPPPGGGSGSGAGAPMRVVEVVPAKSTLDPHTEPLQFQLRPDQGYYVGDQGVKVIIMQGTLKIYEEVHAGAITDKKNVSIAVGRIPVHTSGMAVVIVQDVATGKVLNTAKIMLYPGT